MGDDDKPSKHVKMDVAPDDDSHEQKKKGEGGLARKGTGFVNLSELPSDTDEEEEEEARPAAKKKAKAGPKFADDSDEDSKGGSGKKVMICSDEGDGGKWHVDSK